MEEIKAIETEYNGYRFRSRLEARWAVFFDNAGIKYEYEPEGFELEDGTMYLPDFYLPDLKVYAEVKGDPETGEDEIENKAVRFVGNGESNIHRLVILSNVPPTKGINCHCVIEYVPSCNCFGRMWGFFRSTMQNGGFDGPTRLSSLSIEMFGMPKSFMETSTLEDLLTSKRFSDHTVKEIISLYSQVYDKNIAGAYREARQARFEFQGGRK